jgi:hypothetical protein
MSGVSDLTQSLASLQTESKNVKPATLHFSQTHRHLDDTRRPDWDFTWSSHLFINW